MLFGFGWPVIGRGFWESLYHFLSRHPDGVGGRKSTNAKAAAWGCG
jgi:hypothetical protein